MEAKILTLEPVTKSLFEYLQDLKQMKAVILHDKESQVFFTYLHDLGYELKLNVTVTGGKTIFTLK